MFAMFIVLTSRKKFKKMLFFNLTVIFTRLDGDFWPPVYIFTPKVKVLVLTNIYFIIIY